MELLQILLIIQTTAWMWPFNGTITGWFPRQVIIYMIKPMASGNIFIAMESLRAWRPLTTVNLVTAEYLNEDGSKLADTSQSHAGASFKGGLSGWQHYLNNKLYWPGGYEFSNGNQAVVLIQLTINEDGNLENVEVAIPFHPVFDKIALDIIRNSPAWKPAISHNRKVKETFLQPVTFIQPEN